MKTLANFERASRSASVKMLRLSSIKVLFIVSVCVFVLKSDCCVVYVHTGLFSYALCEKLETDLKHEELREWYQLICICCIILYTVSQKSPPFYFSHNSVQN